MLSQIPVITLEPIGAVEAPDLETIAIPSPTGQDMAIAFVSAECAACLRDTLFWLALRQRAAERDAAFLIVSVEPNRAKVAVFARALQSAHPGLRETPVYYSRTVGPTLRIGFVPFYLLIDKDGRMRNRGAGLTPEGTTDDQRAVHFLEPLNNARPDDAGL